jgi:hypothetical protein
MLQMTVFWGVAPCSLVDLYVVKVRCRENLKSRLCYMFFARLKFLHLIKECK